MGEVRDLWTWKPVTCEMLEYLKNMEPDHRIGRSAAIEYLDRCCPEPMPIRIPAAVPVAAIILMALGALGIISMVVR